MSLLARARGLQERIRPIYTWFQGEKWATFAPLKEMLTHDQESRSPLGPPWTAPEMFSRDSLLGSSRIAPASKPHFNLLAIGVRDSIRSLATLSLIFRPSRGRGASTLPSP